MIALRWLLAALVAALAAPASAASHQPGRRPVSWLAQSDAAAYLWSLRRSVPPPASHAVDPFVGLPAPQPGLLSVFDASAEAPQPEFPAARVPQDEAPRAIDQARSSIEAAATVFDGSLAPAPQEPAPAISAEATGRELFDQVRARAAHGHVARDYDVARAYMYGTADHVVVGGVGGIIDVYSRIFVPGSSDDGARYPERGDQNGDGWVDRGGMNAEHVWPQSFFESRSPMKADLHNLVPSFRFPNEERGHYAFGEVTGPPEYSNNAGAKLGQGKFQPPPQAFGPVARMLAYFRTRYDAFRIRGGDYGEGFWNANLELFLRWNRENPPDENEKRRNELVAQFQGNRNPFVDDYTLLDRIGAEALKDHGAPKDRVPDMRPGREKRHGGFGKKRNKHRKGGRRFRRHGRHRPRNHHPRAW